MIIDNEPELELSTWRAASAPETMRAKSLGQARPVRVPRAILLTLVATLAVFVVLSVRPSAALATVAGLDARLRQVPSVWIDTLGIDPSSGTVGKGITVVAHGSFRRDGLRGIRAYRGKEGRWHFDPTTRQVVRETVDNPPSTVYDPESFSIKNLVGDFQHIEAIDHGIAQFEGAKLRLIELRHVDASTQIWFREGGELPLVVVQKRDGEPSPYNVARFRYDVPIDPSVMTPEALSQPLSELVVTEPNQSPKPR